MACAELLLRFGHAGIIEGELLARVHMPQACTLAMVRRPPQDMTTAWQLGVQLWLILLAKAPCNHASLSPHPRRKWKHQVELRTSVSQTGVCGLPGQ